jgi:hypothetical protein
MMAYHCSITALQSLRVTSTSSRRGGWQGIRNPNRILEHRARTRPNHRRCAYLPERDAKMADAMMVDAMMADATLHRMRYRIYFPQPTSHIPSPAVSTNSSELYVRFVLYLTWSLNLQLVLNNFIVQLRSSFDPPYLARPSLTVRPPSVSVPLCLPGHATDAGRSMIVRVTCECVTGVCLCH